MRNAVATVIVLALGAQGGYKPRILGCSMERLHAFDPSVFDYCEVMKADRTKVYCNGYDDVRVKHDNEDFMLEGVMFIGKKPLTDLSPKDTEFWKFHQSCLDITSAVTYHEEKDAELKTRWRHFTSQLPKRATIRFLRMYDPTFDVDYAKFLGPDEPTTRLVAISIPTNAYGETRFRNYLYVAPLRDARVFTLFRVNFELARPLRAVVPGFFAQPTPYLVYYDTSYEARPEWDKLLLEAPDGRKLTVELGHERPHERGHPALFLSSPNMAVRADDMQDADMKLQFCLLHNAFLRHVPDRAPGNPNRVPALCDAPIAVLPSRRGVAVLMQPLYTTA